MRDFTKWQVWRIAHELTLDVCQLTGRFPDAERYGLISQMRRSAASIPTNLAEGAGRDGGTDRARFVAVAMGSTTELEYQFILARDLGYLNAGNAGTRLETIQKLKRMLTAFRKAVKSND